jgi:hypothetical protein
LRNVGSRAALLKAGMQVAGFMLTGQISHESVSQEPLASRSK